jgi:hypothetical protein
MEELTEGWVAWGGKRADHPRDNIIGRSRQVSFPYEQTSSMVQTRTHASLASVPVTLGLQKGSNVSIEKQKTDGVPPGKPEGFICSADKESCSSRYRLQGIPGSHLDPKMLLLGRVYIPEMFRAYGYLRV